jgi:branched-subunit amino acid permease
VIVAKKTPVTDNRTERVLGFMLLSSIGLAIVGIVALYIGNAASIDTTHGIWLTVRVLPAIGLIIGVLLLIARIIVVAVKRNREAKDATN